MDPGTITGNGYTEKGPHGSTYIDPTRFLSLGRQNRYQRRRFNNWMGSSDSSISTGRNTTTTRFDSGIWSEAEKKYDAVKLECRGLLKALKKFRFWLFGRHFLVETDAQTLVWLLNQPPNDLPNAMTTRWLTYIRLFDFDVRHVPGNKNGAADALSRRGAASTDSDDDDVDDYFDAKLYNITARPPRNPTARVWLIDGEYSGDDLEIGTYLETLRRPDDMDDPQFRQFRKKALNFFIRDGYLFKRSRRPGAPPRRVVGTSEQRLEILQALHDEAGHRGRQATFEKVSRRYQWKGMYSDVSDFVKTCEKCQLRKKKRYDEPLHPTWSTLVWEKVGVDVVYMPVTADGYGFIVFARDDLSGWVEARALKRNTALEVSTFLYEDVICRHGLPRKFVMDNGPENKDITKTLLENYNVKNVNISAYHPQSNGLVERGHAPVVNALAKYCHDRQFQQWNAVLPLVL
jgi:hypothetical protein